MLSPKRMPLRTCKPSEKCSPRNANPMHRNKRNFRNRLILSSSSFNNSSSSHLNSNRESHLPINVRPHQQPAPRELLPALTAPTKGQPLSAPKRSLSLQKTLSPQPQPQQAGGLPTEATKTATTRPTTATTRGTTATATGGTTTVEDKAKEEVEADATTLAEEATKDLRIFLRHHCPCPTHPHYFTPPHPPHLQTAVWLCV